MALPFAADIMLPSTLRCSHAWQIVMEVAF